MAENLTRILRLSCCRFLNSAHFAPLARGIGKNFNAQFAPNRLLSKAHFAINGIFWQKELNSSENVLRNETIKQMKNFFVKDSKYIECLWKSIANYLDESSKDYMDLDFVFNLY